jgi:hypothetical protein
MVDKIHQDRCDGRQDSYGSTIGEFKVDRSGKLLASGTILPLVCQETPANSSMLYQNMEDCKGWIGLSPPMAYLYETMGYKANEGYP